MRLNKTSGILLLLAMTVVTACNHKDKKTEARAREVFKGLYSFAPGAKLFQFCGGQSQYWAADSSAQLELKYSQLINFEQSGTQVYAEVEGYKTKSATNGEAAAYDSTLIVKKVIKITKDIPEGCK
ncbi:hypothetical protein [Mucilaginibacter panaciglaebae]|uniref:NlpE C-terminal OB domain-containing protein n=1 Tax=Mucilaginibacter panaciglaebae TaxID=502331 RepID=A0ABP7WRY4_9SPHI